MTGKKHDKRGNVSKVKGNSAYINDIGGGGSKVRIAWIFSQMRHS